jgi:hypothetical protein
MAKFKIPLETLNDPEHVRALYYKFGDLLKVVSTNPELPYREYQVDIPGFKEDEPVHIVFGFGSANIVSIINIIPDIETQIREKKITIASLTETLHNNFPSHYHVVLEFITSLRYDYYLPENVPTTLDGFMQYEIPADSILGLMERFKIFANLIQNDRVWVKPIKDVTYHVISKISDIKLKLNEYRVDYFQLLEALN